MSNILFMQVNGLISRSDILFSLNLAVILIYIRLQLIIFVISFEYSLFLVPGGIASASGNSSVLISQDGEYPCISFVINGSMIVFFNVTTRTQ